MTTSAKADLPSRSTLTNVTGTRDETVTRENAAYPTRPRYFAHRYCRLLTKSCAAQDIGPMGFVLCVTIAMIEDSKRYTGPVTFFTGQLLPLIGATKWDTLDHARRKAVEYGWLHYIPGEQGKRRPGRYWVRIPEELDILDDSPCDEERYQETGNVERKPYPANGDSRGYRGRERDGYRQGERQGEHSYLTLNPIPDPEKLPSVVCSEQPQAVASKPANGEVALSGFTFPTRGKGGSTWALPAPKLAEYREAYPDLDVPGELRKAVQWCRDNPTRRKTAGRGMLAFLTAWLNRATNRPGRTADTAGSLAALDVSFKLEGES